MKINKTQIIKKQLLPELNTYGFEYRGFKNKSWHFEKASDGMKQEIVILEYRYDSSYFTLLLIGHRAVKASSLDSSVKFLDEYWKAETDDEFRALIIYFLSLIKEKGLALLEEASIISDAEIIKRKISRDIFENRENIFKKYIMCHEGMNIGEYSNKTINEWFDVFKREYKFYKVDAIEHMDETEIKEFEEMAVFLSKMLEKHLGGKWIKYESDDMYAFVIGNLHTKIMPSINIVNTLITVFSKNDILFPKQYFEEILKYKF